MDAGAGGNDDDEDDDGLDDDDNDNDDVKNVDDGEDDGGWGVVWGLVDETFGAFVACFLGTFKKRVKVKKTNLNFKSNQYATQEYSIP